MNREILFRGKRTDNGEWVEGYYVYDYGHNQHLILKNELACPNCINDRRKDFSLGYYEVAPSTICQHTGLTDKNGRKIWENDIVWVTDDEGNSGMVDTGEIDFFEGLWYISGSVQNSLYDIDKVFQIEVIGNVGLGN